jgi:hypothetical protein
LKLLDDDVDTVAFLFFSPNAAIGFNLIILTLFDEFILSIIFSIIKLTISDSFKITTDFFVGETLTSIASP